MPIGYNFYQKLSEKVIDGTSCGDEMTGICADGDCKVIKMKRILLYFIDFKIFD